MVNATANGNTLTKTGGCDGCGDADGISTQELTSGDGYFEFTIANTGLLYKVGLDEQNTDTSPGDVDVGQRIENGADVWEKGSWKTGIAATVNDVFKIAVENGEIKYYKNGELFYTSLEIVPYPLHVDAQVLQERRSILYQYKFAAYLSCPCRYIAR